MHYIGPLTMTDENGETTLIGVVMADGDPPEIGTDNKVCHGTTAFGRVSNPDTLNWIKQAITQGALPFKCRV